MKPLFHPSPDDVTVEGILHALSDPVRARIFAEIVRAEHPRTCIGAMALCDQAVPKSTLSQHFRVLREAGLIRSERRGVELHNTPRCAELEGRFGNLVELILKAHAAQVMRAQKSKRSKSA